MEKITEILADQDLSEVTEVIRRSFLTVANDFGLTKENAPTNPAFITCEDLKGSLARGLRLFGMIHEGKNIACVGIEPSNEKDVYYLERLAVLPEHRHRGIGLRVMDYAIARIREHGGRRVSIGIIDENERLKAWYARHGFIEKGRKTFQHLPFTVCFMERER